MAFKAHTVEMLKTIPLATTVSLVIIYVLLAGGPLGWDLREWGAAYDKQAQYADNLRRAECRALLTKGDEV